MWGGGGRGGREHPPLTHIQSNARRFLFLLFIYLRFAEAASFDKKSYAGAIQFKSFSSKYVYVEAATTTAAPSHVLSPVYCYSCVHMLSYEEVQTHIL